VNAMTTPLRGTGPLAAPLPLRRGARAGLPDVTRQAQSPHESLARFRICDRFTSDFCRNNVRSAIVYASASLFASGSFLTVHFFFIPMQRCGPHGTETLARTVKNDPEANKLLTRNYRAPSLFLQKSDVIPIRIFKTALVIMAVIALAASHLEAQRGRRGAGGKWRG